MSADLSWTTVPSWHAAFDTCRALGVARETNPWDGAWEIPAWAAAAAVAHEHAAREVSVGDSRLRRCGPARRWVSALEDVLRAVHARPELAASVEVAAALADRGANSRIDGLLNKNRVARAVLQVLHDGLGPELVRWPA